MKKPSLGVLVPSFNSIRWLPGHLKSMQSWLDLADEVVVVDSQSTDGSLELFQRELNHRNVRILQHPRGLYQSWNFGVKNIQSDYTYISTVGDSITREGLLHLQVLAERFKADVVVSKPRFIKESGEPSNDVSWPIDNVIETLGLKAPVCLSGVPLYLLVLANCTGAILGSSASNLYRRDCLQSKPFPTEFGTVGDGAWGCAHALDIRLAVTLEKFSDFRDHPKSYAKKDYAVKDLPLRLFEVARDTGERHFRQEGAIKDDLAKTNALSIAKVVEQWLLNQRALETERNRKFPWALNPSAWYHRSLRSRKQSEAQALTAAALKMLGTIHA